MFRSRNNLAVLWSKLTRGIGSASQVPTVPTLQSTQLLQVLHNRELAGASTTLRQLHKVSQLSQPEALRVVAALEDEGVVVIKHDLVDAFESTVSLARNARLKLDKGVKSGFG